MDTGTDIGNKDGGGENATMKAAIHDPQLSSAWSYYQTADNCQIWAAGHVQDIEAFIEAFLTDSHTSLEALCLKERECFGLVLRTGDRIWVVADRVRSYPVFYQTNANSHVISSTADPLITDEQVRDPDPLQLRNFLAAGYSLGEETICRDVHRLLPGSYLIADQNGIKVKRYYLYHPSFDGAGDPAKLKADLLEILRRAARRVVERAEGQTVWVPLSAGYDSRAILCLLHEAGCPNLKTFSYGTPNNMEARVARDLAGKLGVDWQFVSSMPAGYRSDFYSEEATDYLLQAGSLGASPAFTEYFALKHMMQSGIAKPGDFIINGQTGDYLTGGHIPGKIANFQDVAGYVLKKHFGLHAEFRDEIGLAGMQEILDEWSRKYLGFGAEKLQTEEDLAAWYQAFEWHERQCQYLINQQRAYDFFGLNWCLPLWDADLMDFYAKVPLDQQRGQKLYIDCLHDWNYQGMFDQGRIPYDPWPRFGAAIIFMARCYGLVAGSKAKDRFYKLMNYWGDRYHQWSLFGLGNYRNFIRDLRNPASFLTLEYLYRLKSRLGIKDESALEQRYNRRRPEA